MSPTPRSDMPEYPRTIELAGRSLVLRPMGPADVPAIVAFARALPPHDLLFLRRDITDPSQVADWVDDIARGHSTTILALDRDQVHGYSAVFRSPLRWTRHVAELRVLVSPALRGQGLGDLLTQEAFLIALAQDVRKMVVQMTIDQNAAVELSRRMGFTPEAILRDHVRDEDGKTYDLVVMSHDVEAFARRSLALGIDRI